MATKINLRCVVCGSQRLLTNFFGDYDFDDEFDPLEAPIYELALGIQEIGGRGQCSWDFEPIAEEIALTLHTRLENVTRQLEDYIDAKREEDGRPPLVWSEEQDAED